MHILHYFKFGSASLLGRNSKQYKICISQPDSLDCKTFSLSVYFTMHKNSSQYFLINYFPFNKDVEKYTNLTDHIFSDTEGLLNLTNCQLPCESVDYQTKGLYFMFCLYTKSWNLTIQLDSPFLMAWKVF